jgi:hypothetical protein
VGADEERVRLLRAKSFEDVLAGDEGAGTQADIYGERAV